MQQCHIKILTWNYDSQIQIAAESFRKEEFSNIGSASMHKPPLVPYYPSMGPGYMENPNELSMIHLNGIASFYRYEFQDININPFLALNVNTTNDLLNILYGKDYGRNHMKSPLITFAWEKETKAAVVLSKRLLHAKALIKDTDILVVIGYSFPFFNREIDKEMFNSLKEGGRLKKIFFQDPYLDGQFLINQFELDPVQIEIRHVKQTDNYFVPIEL